MMIAIIINARKVDYILIDTFSTSNFYYAYIASQLSRLLRLKYISVLRGGNLPMRLDKYPYLSKSIFKNSYQNIAPSNYLKYEFEKKGFKVDFIPNILEINEYEFKKRETLKPTILWVRAFKYLYNPKMAIEVLILLKKQYPEAKLCMIGPVKDDSFELVKSMVVENNLTDSVEFTGALSKKEWFKKSEEFDIFINTTNVDNTPVSVMEAMALGLSVVSTNVGGMPFLIDNQLDGLLVEKENPDEMAKTIVKLINNHSQDMTMNARKKVESFSWEHLRKQWIKLLN